MTGYEVHAMAQEEKRELLRSMTDEGLSEVTATRIMSADMDPIVLWAAYQIMAKFADAQEKA